MAKTQNHKKSPNTDKTMKRLDHSSAICDQNQAKLYNQASKEQPTGINIEIHQQIKCIF